MATNIRIIRRYDFHFSADNERRVQVANFTGPARLVYWRAELETIDYAFTVTNLPYFRIELYNAKAAGNPIPSPGEKNFVDQLYFSPMSITWGGAALFYASMENIKERGQFISRSPVIPDLSKLWIYFDSTFLADLPIVNVTMLIRLEDTTAMEGVQASLGQLSLS